MRKLLSTLSSTLQGGVRGGLLLLAFMATTALWAYDFQSGDLYYNITSSSEPYTVEVTYKSLRANYSNTTLVIPSSVEYNGITYTVTSIGAQAFMNCKQLTAITIPNSVIAIGGSAFTSSALYKDESNWENECLYVDNCLISAKRTLSGSCAIKEGTRVIAGSAFGTCASLTAVDIPNSVIGIGSGAFRNCSALTSVVIPSGVTSIEDYTFNECTSLSSITLPNTITRIGDFALSNCSTLVAFDMPTHVKSIGKAAFGNCIGLTSAIVIPEGVTCIADSAFLLCTHIPSISLPQTITQIGNYAFSNCLALTSITIPKNVTKIGSFAFNYCYPNAIVVEKGNTHYDSRDNCNAIIETASNKLIKGCCNTTIPNTVTQIEGYAFVYHACPTSLTIPKSVVNIGLFSFYDCYKLSSIVVENGNPIYDSRDNCNAIIETASNKLIKGCCNTTIPNTITSIGDYAFYDVFIYDSASIVIPNSVKSIGDFAFCYCTKLVSVALPEGLTSIGQFAFYYCFDLANINFPNSMTDIGQSAFYFCRSLKSVVIPDNVTSVGTGAFYNCFSLESLTIGSGVQTFGWNAFENTYALKTVICKIVEVPVVQFYFSGTVFADATLYVPAESIEEYKADYTWGKFGTILPLDQAPSGVENVTSLGNYKQSQIKTIHNGQLLIIRDGVEYNALGVRL